MDATSFMLLVFLTIVLYGDELTAWLARLLADRLSEREESNPRLPERIREVAAQVERARVAFGEKGMAGCGAVGVAAEQIIERAAGHPQAALLLVWGALEDRLRAATGAGDGVEGAVRLAERGKVPQEFVEAFDAFRALRNDVARSATADSDEPAIWSLIDTGAGLLGLVPAPSAWD